MRLTSLAIVAVLLSTVVGLCTAFAASDDHKKEWSRALRAGKPKAIERLIHTFAVEKDTRRLQKILDGQLARLPLLSSSKVNASQAEVYRALLTVGRYFTDAKSLQAIGDFLYTRAGTPGGEELLAVVVTSNASPYVIRALEELATAAKKPTHVKRLSDASFRNIRLFAIEKIATVRTWEAAAALVGVLEAEEGISKSGLTYVQRRTGALLSKLTGRKAGASAVNWAGYVAKRQSRRFPSPDDEDDDDGRTAVDDYDEKELFSGETPSPEFVVVVGALWTKPNSELLRKANQIKKGETEEDLLENDRNHRQEYGIADGLIENMLKEMEIPFTKIQREDLDTYDLTKTGVLIFKCAQFHRNCICKSCSATNAKAGLRLYRDQCSLDPAVHVSWTPEITDAAAKQVQMFVKNGGYVFGEDWTIREILERLWPEFVTAVKKKEKKGERRAATVGKRKKADLTLREQTIKVSVATPSHPYAHKILNRKMDTIKAKTKKRKKKSKKKSEGRTYVVHPPDPPEGNKHDGFEWPVDEASFAAHVAKPDRVTTLLVSDDIKKACEKGAGESGTGSVALTFAPYGQAALKKARLATSVRRKKRLRGGAVLWTLGHLATQEGSTEDIYSIEYLLLNFINESWARGVPR